MNLIDDLEGKGQLPDSELRAARHVITHAYSQAYKLFDWYVRELKAGRVQTWMRERNPHRTPAAGILSWGLDHLARAGQHFERLREHNQPLPQFKQFAYADLVNWLDEEDSSLLAEDADGYEERDVAMELNDGWTWQWLAATDTYLEGDLMGNCIGDYADYMEDGGISILSLKDARNVPHVDIEFAWCSFIDNDVVLQVKGKANTTPTKYAEQIRAFFRTYPASWIPENLQYEGGGGGFYLNTPEQMTIENAHDLVWANNELQARNIESFGVEFIPERQDQWGITQGSMRIPPVVHWYDASRTLFFLLDLENDDHLREAIAAYYNLIRYQDEVTEANRYVDETGSLTLNTPSVDDVRADLEASEDSRGKEGMLALLDAAPMLWVQPENVPLPALETPKADQSLPQPTPPTSPWQEGNYADQ